MIICLFSYILEPLWGNSWTSLTRAAQTRSCSQDFAASPLQSTYHLHNSIISLIVIEHLPSPLGYELHEFRDLVHLPALDPSTLHGVAAPQVFFVERINEPVKVLGMVGGVGQEVWPQGPDSPSSCSVGRAEDLGGVRSSKLSPKPATV